MANKKYLNLGCGSVYSTKKEWINADLSGGGDVISIDVRKKLPFVDQDFDLVYSSHLLEHLELEEAESLLEELFRITKQGGVVRVVVPDLEQIARLYLKKYEQVSSGKEEKEIEYDWMLLELFDQMTRGKTGGRELDLIKNAPKNNSFIKKRLGNSYRKYLDYSKLSFVDKAKKALREKGSGWIVKEIYYRLLSYLILILGGRNLYKGFKRGVFYTKGETHKFMYDDFSLSRVLKRVGFSHPTRKTATESKIINFSKYNLDTINGEPRKPDSLYMEAIKK